MEAPRHRSWPKYGSAERNTGASERGLRCNSAFPSCCGERVTPSATLQDTNAARERARALPQNTANNQVKTCDEYLCKENRRDLTFYQSKSLVSSKRRGTEATVYTAGADLIALAFPGADRPLALPATGNQRLLIRAKEERTQTVQSPGHGLNSSGNASSQAQPAGSDSTPAVAALACQADSPSGPLSPGHGLPALLP